MEKLLIDIRNENETIQGYFNKDLITVDDLLTAVDDLLYEKDCLEEKIEDIEKYYNDNYKPISAMEMYGLSERNYH